MKAILAMLTLVVATVFAGEMDCEDFLRTVDGSGVKILPKTFDQIVSSPADWTCLDTDGQLVAISNRSHHILTVSGQDSKDLFVDFVNGAEREISISYTDGRRTTEFLSRGSIEDQMNSHL